MNSNQREALRQEATVAREEPRSQPTILKRLLILNPNTSVDITASILEQTRRHLPSSIIPVSRTARTGDRVIATAAAFARAAENIAVDINRGDETADAILLACFGDPGLQHLRHAVSPLPVIGLADACFRKAPSPFAVLTLGPDWGPILQAQAEASRPSACVGVWALAATGLDFVRDPASLVARMDIACDEAAAAGARSIILGGVVLAGKGDLLRSKVPLIDCIEAAAEAAVACLCGGAMTSHQQPADRTVTTPTPSH